MVRFQRAGQVKDAVKIGGIPGRRARGGLFWQMEQAQLWPFGRCAFVVAKKILRGPEYLPRTWRVRAGLAAHSVTGTLGLAANFETGTWAWRPILRRKHGPGGGQSWEAGGWEGVETATHGNSRFFSAGQPVRPQFQLSEMAQPFGMIYAILLIKY